MHPAADVNEQISNLKVKSESQNGTDSAVQLRGGLYPCRQRLGQAADELNQPGLVDSPRLVDHDFSPVPIFFIIDNRDAKWPDVPAPRLFGIEET